MKIFLEICQGIEYIHKKEMAHRDIKLQNILCLLDGSKIKLCDFGFLVEDKESYVSSRLVGTKLYMAPE